MNNAGYSGTPLAKKLGIKEGFKITVLHAPDYYFHLFAELPAVQAVNDAHTKKDFIHYFTTAAEQLAKDMSLLKEQLEPCGALWISWPKKAAKVPTDVTEDVIRTLALQNGLVDVKVCAVDEVWSGLKLVISVKQRKPSG